MLKNDYLLAKIGVDAVENEPREELSKEVHPKEPDRAAQRPCNAATEAVCAPACAARKTTDLS